MTHEPEAEREQESDRHERPVWTHTEADAEVADLLALLGKRHTLELLYVFARDPGPWRFGELETGLGLSPTTLSLRLSECVEAGFLERQVHDEHPPRVEYVATERAEALKPAFTHLYRFVTEYGIEASS